MSMPNRAKAMQESSRMLKIAWQRAGERWTDKQHARFGAQWVEPLERAVRHAAGALDEVQALLHKAEQDCR